MWKSLLVLCLIISCASKNELVMDRSLHEFRGKLVTGMMAIGGETTGVILQASDGKTYELFMKNTGQLKKYKNKNVVLKGKLTIDPGVEIQSRNIIEVAEIREE